MGDDNLTEALNFAVKSKPTNIRKMQELVEAVNIKNGWFDSSRTFGEDIALLHSEVSEALDAFRDYGLDDVTEIVDKNSLSVAKPEGVGSELADVLVRLLDTCERYDIDLTAEFWRKLQYNATRSYRHGNRSL